MKKIEKIMLIDLFESVNGLYAFTFYSRYSVKPDEIFLFIEKYLKLDVISYEEDKLTVTENGRLVILKEIFSNKTGKSSRKSIPKEFLRDRIEINFPYLPNRSSVPDEILNMKKVE